MIQCCIAIVLRLAFSCAWESEGMFVLCLTAAPGTKDLLDYHDIANIVWNIDIPPMINESL
jgi:hypothetical protein